MASPTTERSVDTYVWIERRPRSGVSSPYTAFSSVPVETGVPAFAMSVANTVRCFWPPTLSGVSLIVAVTGPIGFVGMMMPHIARLLIGSDHRTLTPASLLAGGVFLVLCDRLARLVVPPSGIPVGVVTALLGGPFFLWLLIRRGVD